jgi:hypothetical protein
MTNNDNNDLSKDVSERSALVSEQTEKLEQNTMYNARLEFRSVGEANQVHPYFSYSHQFPDNYQGPWPAAYLAMRDLAFDLAVMAQTVFNTELGDENMPSDPDMLAEVSLSMAKDQADAAASKKH